MQTLREAIMEARAKGRALGHFNISDLAAFHAVKEAAKQEGVPAIVGLSEGERDFVGLREAVALVAEARAEGIPLYLNADHSYSFATAKEAIDAGFDAVIFDGAKLPFDENATLTKEVAAYARKSGRDVLVEGELGYIGTSSKLLDEVPEGVAAANMTTPEEARAFVEMTGIDLFSPAVGSIHGMLVKQELQPGLDIERIRAIKEAVGVPLVLHGGSGTTDEDFTKAIEAGIAVIHISTELRAAYREAVEAELAAHDDVAPYKIFGPGQKAMEEIVARRLRLFTKS